MQSIKLIFFFTLICWMNSNAQNICDGNLGDNIFSIGDFGAGTSNVIQEDPKIAPGYIYTTNTPPNDGYYTITNDMELWNNPWGSWMEIKDNSPDPEGYMMVVNASYNPGVFYEELVDGLCENTLYEFSADVINLIRTGVANHIQPNVSFLLNGVEMVSSGGISQDETWHKYGFTFTTELNQTDVTLTLRNNAPGGIGNDLALDNISFRPCGPDAFANAESEFLLCSNDIDPVEIEAVTSDNQSIQWQYLSESSGMWEDVPGETNNSIFHDNFNIGAYKYRYLSAGSSENLLNAKCRVISDTATVTVLPIDFILYDTICEAIAYQFGSQEIFAEGFYEETFVASNGCDSFVDLFLTIVPEIGFDYELNITHPSCFSAEDGSMEIINTTGGYAPIMFSTDTTITDFGSFFDLSAGSHTVHISDHFQCKETLEIILEDPEQFYFDLPGDTSINLGETYNFSFFTNYGLAGVDWMGEELSCVTCINNSTRPLEGTEYFAIATSEFGCQDTARIYIALNEIQDQFYKPNIFSPNEDGINDEFIIYTSSKAIDEVELYLIVDRWGNKVFAATNEVFGSPELIWDGYLASNKAETGAYAYFMKLRLINGHTIFVKGDVSLVR